MVKFLTLTITIFGPSQKKVVEVKIFRVQFELKDRKLCVKEKILVKSISLFPQMQILQILTSLKLCCFGKELNSRW